MSVVGSAEPTFEDPASEGNRCGAPLPSLPWEAEHPSAQMAPPAMTARSDVETPVCDEFVWPGTPLWAVRRLVNSKRLSQLDQQGIGHGGVTQRVDVEGAAQGRGV